MTRKPTKDDNCVEMLRDLASMIYGPLGVEIDHNQFDILSKLVDEMQPLGEPYQSIMDKNIEDLYES